MQKRQANPKLPLKSLILIGSRQGTDGKSISSSASVGRSSSCRANNPSGCSVTADNPSGLPPRARHCSLRPSTIFCSRQVTRQWIGGDTAWGGPWGHVRPLLGLLGAYAESTHGYEATREAAMAAFAKSWRKE